MDASQYVSFLLRLWPVKVAGATLWRASLESPATGERLGFADMEALFAYLEQTTQELDPDPFAGPETGSQSLAP